MKRIPIIFLTLCLAACNTETRVPLDTFAIAEKLCANHDGVKTITVLTQCITSCVNGSHRSKINVVCKHPGTYATQVVHWKY